MNYTKFLCLVPQAFLDTLIMMAITVAFSCLIGFFLGIYLYYVDKGLFKKNILSHALAVLIDSIRSFPFSIFIIALLPVSKFFLGSSFGMKAAFLPMIFAGSCYFARLCQGVFHTLSKEMLDAAILMGFTYKDLALRLILRETLPQLVQNIALLANAALSYSAVAGLVGGGGLGKLALDYGYYRFNTEILFSTVFLILVIGKACQYLGEYGFKKIMLKRGLHAKP